MRLHTSLQVLDAFKLKSYRLQKKVNIWGGRKYSCELVNITFIHYFANSIILQLLTDTSN